MSNSQEIDTQNRDLSRTQIKIGIRLKILFAVTCVVVFIVFCTVLGLYIKEKRKEKYGGFQQTFVKDRCSGGWSTVLKTSTNGTAITGRKRDLVDRLVAGDDIRISFNEKTYFTSIQSATLTENDNVCVQALFQLSRSLSNTDFDSDIHWEFLIVCTTGHLHVSKWSVGEHVNRGRETGRADIEWYVRSQPGQKRVFCNTYTGGRICGERSLLEKAVYNGASVKVFNPEDGFITSLTRVDVSSDSSSIHGQYPWRLGQIKVGEGYEFPTRVFWWLTIWSTTGSIPTSQWFVGEHTNRLRSLENASMEWIVDDCWTQTYTNDFFGNSLNGSLDLLVEAVLAGKRVRVKIDLEEYVVETDNLLIKDGHVSAQLLGQYTKTRRAYDLPTNVSWVWSSVSTTGHITTVHNSIGISHLKYTRGGDEETTWFVESRPWSRVLTTSSTGIVTQGSKANLITALQRGYSLRLVVYEKEDSVSVIEADNIFIQNSEVSVQTIRYIGDENGTRTIPTHYPVYWRFIMTSTDGKQRVVLWKVGEHSSLPATTKNYRVDWVVG